MKSSDLLPNGSFRHPSNTVCFQSDVPEPFLLECLWSVERKVTKVVYLPFYLSDNSHAASKLAFLSWLVSLNM